MKDSRGRLSDDNDVALQWIFVAVVLAAVFGLLAIAIDPTCSQHVFEFWFATSLGCFFIVFFRWLNRRDDPRNAKHPPDEP